MSGLTRKEFDRLAVRIGRTALGSSVEDIRGAIADAVSAGIQGLVSKLEDSAAVTHVGGKEAPELMRAKLLADEMSREVQSFAQIPVGEPRREPDGPMKRVKCPGCGRTIVWVTNETTGTRIPLQELGVVFTIAKHGKTARTLNYAQRIANDHRRDCPCPEKVQEVDRP